MKVIRCDICNNEMTDIFNRDSETQYYTLIKNDAGRKLETDICNECMHKLMDFVKMRGIDIVECDECIWRDDCSQTVANFERTVNTALRWCSDGEREEE